MTADDGDIPTETQLPETDSAPARRRRPPLWRSAKDRRRSPLEVSLTALGMLVVASGFGALLLEGHFLSGPATATRVTITAIESVSHADENSPGYITYKVSLPDGRSARFTSSQTHRPGTRLMAMVSRGRLTGRTIVTSPYVVLPDE
jgi:hypothetical protein